MRPVGDAMAIAMRDVEKIDRKILVVDLQIFATSVVANVGIFRCFSGAVLARKYARKYLLANICEQFLLANSSKRSQIWDICYICDHICEHKNICHQQIY